MPETNETKKNVSGSKDGLALIIGGLFILALVFAAYNYFNKATNSNQQQQAEEQANLLDKLRDEEKKAEEKGDLNGDGAKSEASGTVSNNTGSATSTWVANDYKSGDIKAGSYTVKSGDTLWEIAEAAYGNGAEWTKILEANESTIGFLPNGSQALIVPGQVLVLP